MFVTRIAFDVTSLSKPTSKPFTCTPADSIVPLAFSDVPVFVNRIVLDVELPNPETACKVVTIPVKLLALPGPNVAATILPSVSMLEAMREPPTSILPDAANEVSSFVSWIVTFDDAPWSVAFCRDVSTPERLLPSPLN